MRLGEKFAVLSVLGIAVAACAGVVAQSSTINHAEFAADGKVKIPKNWREWVYVGTPLTPNALNGGEAPFPEFHNVYIEPSAWEHYKASGKFANGTQIAKELVSVRENDNAEDGSSSEVSGQGYFQGEFIGLELTVKDTEKFADQPGGWVYYSFGHHPEPYEQTAEAFPADACNACHEANADDDFVFTQFYPVLRSVKQ